MRLKRTKEEGWDYIRMWPQSHFDSATPESLNPREDDLLERVGSSLTKAMELRGRKARARREHERWLNDRNIGR